MWWACRWNASEVANCLAFYHFFFYYLPLPWLQCDKLIWTFLASQLYLRDKYEVCGADIKDMAMFQFLEHLTLTLGQGHLHLDDYILLKCTLFDWILVPSIKSVDEITPKVWPIEEFFHPYRGTFDLDLGPWPSVKVTVTSVIELYLSTKYEVYR